MTKQNEKCPNKSEYIYSWAGRLIHGCNRHANAMRMLAQVIGTPFDAEPDVGGMQQGRMCDQNNDLE